MSGFFTHSIYVLFIYLLKRFYIFATINILVYNIHQEPYNRFWFSILFLSNAVNNPINNLL